MPSQVEIKPFYHLNTLKYSNVLKSNRKEGISPEDLALTVTLGIIVGVFPVVGTTSLLSFLAAWAFGLNVPILQVIDLVMSPFCLAL